MRKLDGDTLNMAIRGFQPHRTHTQWLRGRRIPAMIMTEHMLAFTAALQPRMRQNPANTDQPPHQQQRMEINR